MAGDFAESRNPLFPLANLIGASYRRSIIPVFVTGRGRREASPRRRNLFQNKPPVPNS